MRVVVRRPLRDEQGAEGRVPQGKTFIPEEETWDDTTRVACVRRHCPESVGNPALDNEKQGKVDGT